MVKSHLVISLLWEVDEYIIIFKAAHSSFCFIVIFFIIGLQQFKYNPLQTGCPIGRKSKKLDSESAPNHSLIKRAKDNHKNKYSPVS